MLVNALFAIAIILTLAIYIYRFREIIRGLHQPSMATWPMYFLNAFFTAIFAAQTNSGLLFVLSQILNSILIFILIILSIASVKKYGRIGWEYTKFDIVVAVISAGVIVAYYFGFSVTLSATTLWLVTRLSELPTARKVYSAPFSEIIWVDIVGALRSFMLFWTLEEVNSIGIFNTIGSAVVMLITAAWCFYNQHRVAKHAGKTISEMRNQQLSIVRRRKKLKRSI